MKGLITSIQRLSIHDGPGIRSTVFLKGCNMRCDWCHNPETHLPTPQLQYIAGKCICCAHCLSSCPEGALTVKDNRIWIDRSACTVCGSCAEACTSGALSLVGESLTPEELMERISKDELFIRNSGGGVTLSGGEPTLQAAFCRRVLELCVEKDYPTAIETNLACTEEVLDSLIPFVGLWFCDLKMADPQKHRHYTGLGNERIIHNLHYLSEKKVTLVVRTPIIPGVNDNTKEMEGLCSILRPLNLKHYELLPFHSLGFYKWINLGMNNPMERVGDLAKDRLNELTELARSLGIPAKQ